MNQKNSNRNFSTAASNLSWRQSTPLIAGAALAVFGLSRRSTPGFLLAAAGGTLAYAGWRTNFPEPGESLARGSVLINCAPEEAYGRYRKLEDLPTFMHHLEIRHQDRRKAISLGRTRPGGHTHRVGRGNCRRTRGRVPLLALFARLRADSRGFSALRESSGRSRDHTHRDHAFRSPRGQSGFAIAKLFGKDPSFIMQQDLRRFKALIETGEIPTTEGQTHGPRSLKAVAAKTCRSRSAHRARLHKQPKS